MSEFFAMGGYAAFVWPAYAVAAVIMIGLLVSSLKAARDAASDAVRLEAERPRRRRGARGEPRHDT